MCVSRDAPVKKYVPIDVAEVARGSTSIILILVQSAKNRLPIFVTVDSGDRSNVSMLLQEAMKVWPMVVVF